MISPALLSCKDMVALGRSFFPLPQEILQFSQKKSRHFFALCNKIPTFANAYNKCGWDFIQLRRTHGQCGPH